MQVILRRAVSAGRPRREKPPTIPTEAGKGSAFDGPRLSLRNRFPGFDRVDGGERVDYGLRAGYYGDKGGSTRILVGQSYEGAVNPNFLPGSGLDHPLSDVLGRVRATPTPYLATVYHSRLT